MPLTSRKRRPLNRAIPHLRDTKLFVVATEGQRTEKQYFDVFQNARVQVRVIPSDSGFSAPEQVLERLDQFKQEYQVEDDDELWLLVDVDRWGSAKLSKVAALTLQKGYKLGISNPCFEVWLYLHFNDLPVRDLTCADIVELLRQELGSYNKSKLNTEPFKNHIREAVERARRLHVNAGERWPTALGTHVYKLVEQLL